MKPEIPVNAAPEFAPHEDAPSRAPSRVGGGLVLLAAGALLFFWRLGSHDLWPPDEPRFALVAKEMLARGDLCVLSLNDHLYTDKPPLFFWAINAFGLLRGGVDEWSARLPSAISSLLALFLVARLGEWLYDRRTGFWAALVFGTSAEILVRARWASIDMTLNLFVLAAILLLYRAWTRADSSPGVARMAWLAMGLATLAKGPVGVIVPLLAVLPAVLLERDGRATRRLLLPSGILLYFAVTLVWFGPYAARLGWGTAAQIATHQTVQRYLNAWNGQHPVWYYLWEFPMAFLPWSLFLPGACALAVIPEPGRDRRRAALFLFTWIAAIFVFFSFSTGKRGVYIIPLYPAAAILVGRLLARASEAREEPAGAARRRLVWPLRLWVLVTAVLAAGLPLSTWRRFPELRVAAIVLGGILLTGALGAVLLRRRHPVAAPALVPLSMTAALLLVMEAIVPWANRYQNLRGFAESVRPHLVQGIPFATTEQKREAWVFYTGRFAEEVDTRDRVLAYLSQPPPRDLVIDGRLLREVRDTLPEGVVEVLRERVAGQDYHLVRRGSAP